MEKEKTIIRDQRRSPELEIDSDHPYFKEIKNSLMPDDYRAGMDRISNIEDDVREEIIKDYYKQIENPYDETFHEVVIPFFPLTPIDLWINESFKMTGRRRP